MGTATYTGDDVLAWFESEDAQRQAIRLARGWGLGYDGLAENILQHARVAMWKRMQSADPLDVKAPGGYGTAVIRSVIRKLAAGRSAVDPPEESEPAVDVTAGDGLRVIVERLADRRVWLTSAVLTYLTITMHPGAEPDHTPKPIAGARKADQSLGWPALWFAGVRDVFPEDWDTPAEAAARRRRRARHIEHVLGRFTSAASLYRVEGRGSGG